MEVIRVIADFFDTVLRSAPDSHDFRRLFRHDPARLFRSAQLFESSSRCAFGSVAFFRSTQALPVGTRAQENFGLR
jgi:hypothetical protein